MHVKYWLRLTGSILLIGILGGLAMSLYMVLINTEMSLRDVPETLPMMILMMSLLGCFVFGATAFSVYVPMAVSFGCTRREAFWGMQLMMVAAVAVLTLVLGIVSRLLPGDIAKLVWSLLPAVGGALLGFGSVGEIMGTLYDRYGKLGVVIGIVVGLLTGFGMVIAMNYTVSALGDGLSAMNKNIVNYIVPGVGVLLWGAELLVLRLILRRYAARF